MGLGVEEMWGFNGSRVGRKMGRGVREGKMRMKRRGREKRMGRREK